MITPCNVLTAQHRPSLSQSSPRVHRTDLQKVPRSLGTEGHGADLDAGLQVGGVGTLLALLCSFCSHLCCDRIGWVDGFCAVWFGLDASTLVWGVSLISQHVVTGSRLFAY